MGIGEFFYGNIMGMSLVLEKMSPSIPPGFLNKNSVNVWWFHMSMMMVSPMYDFDLAKWNISIFLIGKIWYPLSVNRPFSIAIVEKKRPRTSEDGLRPMYDFPHESGDEYPKPQTTSQRGNVSSIFFWIFVRFHSLYESFSGFTFYLIQRWIVLLERLKWVASSEVSLDFELWS